MKTITNKLEGISVLVNFNVGGKTIPAFSDGPNLGPGQTKNVVDPGQTSDVILTITSVLATRRVGDILVPSEPKGLRIEVPEKDISKYVQYTLNRDGTYDISYYFDLINTSNNTPSDDEKSPGSKVQDAEDEARIEHPED